MRDMKLRLFCLGSSLYMGVCAQVVPSGLNPWKEAAENMTRVMF